MGFGLSCYKCNKKDGKNQQSVSNFRLLSWFANLRMLNFINY
jgi:hypothetical protein